MEEYPVHFYTRLMHKHLISECMWRESSHRRDNYFCSLFWLFCLLHFRFILRGIIRLSIETPGFKCRSLNPNLTSVLLARRKCRVARKRYRISFHVAFGVSSFSSRPQREKSTGLRGVLKRPRRFTSLEELIAPRAEKFMAGFHLALSYRWDGAIIARMGCYLECRKVADGLSPLTRREAEERCLRYFPICLLARFESRDVRLTQLTHLDV